MDDISTRAIIIGVNIFVTITIVSLLIVMFSQMGEIYGLVSTIDTSISSRFSDIYSMYHGRTETGVGLLNTIKTFEEDNEYQVVIRYPGDEAVREKLANDNIGRDEQEQKRESQYLKELIINNTSIKGFTYEYEDRYDVTVYETEEGILEINFVR